MAEVCQAAAKLDVGPWIAALEFEADAVQRERIGPVFLEEVVAHGFKIAKGSELLVGDAKPAVGGIDQKGAAFGEDDGAIMEDVIAGVVAVQVDVEDVKTGFPGEHDIELREFLTVEDLGFVIETGEDLAGCSGAALASLGKGMGQGIENGFGSGEGVFRAEGKLFSPLGDFRRTGEGVFCEGEFFRREQVV